MSYNKPLLLSVCQGGILRFHGHRRAFPGLLAGDIVGGFSYVFGGVANDPHPLPHHEFYLVLLVM